MNIVAVLSERGFVIILSRRRNDHLKSREFHIIRIALFIVSKFVAERLFAEKRRVFARKHYLRKPRAARKSFGLYFFYSRSEFDVENALICKERHFAYRFERIGEHERGYAYAEVKRTVAYRFKIFAERQVVYRRTIIKRVFAYALYIVERRNFYQIVKRIRIFEKRSGFVFFAVRINFLYFRFGVARIRRERALPYSLYVRQPFKANIRACVGRFAERKTIFKRGFADSRQRLRIIERDVFERIRRIKRAFAYFGDFRIYADRGKSFREKLIFEMQVAHI